jgi:hypothetical protein
MMNDFQVIEFENVKNKSELRSEDRVTVKNIF